MSALASLFVSFFHWKFIRQNLVEDGRGFDQIISPLFMKKKSKCIDATLKNCISTKIKWLSKILKCCYLPVLSSTKRRGTRELINRNSSVLSPCCLLCLYCECPELPSKPYLLINVHLLIRSEGETVDTDSTILDAVWSRRDCKFSAHESSETTIPFG